MSPVSCVPLGRGASPPLQPSRPTVGRSPRGALGVPRCGGAAPRPVAPARKPRPVHQRRLHATRRTHGGGAGPDPARRPTTGRGHGQAGRAPAGPAAGAPARGAPPGGHGPLPPGRRPGAVVLRGRPQPRYDGAGRRRGVDGVDPERLGHAAAPPRRPAEPPGAGARRALPQPLGGGRGGLAGPGHPAVGADRTTVVALVLPGAGGGPGRRLRQPRAAPSPAGRGGRHGRHPLRGGRPGPGAGPHAQPGPRARPLRPARAGRTARAMAQGRRRAGGRSGGRHLQRRAGRAGPRRGGARRPGALRPDDPPSSRGWTSTPPRPTTWCTPCRTHH